MQLLREHIRSVTGGPSAIHSSCRFLPSKDTMNKHQRISDTVFTVAKWVSRGRRACLALLLPIPSRGVPKLLELFWVAKPGLCHVRRYIGLTSATTPL